MCDGGLLPSAGSRTFGRVPSPETRSGGDPDRGQALLSFARGTGGKAASEGAGFASPGGKAMKLLDCSHGRGCGLAPGVQRKGIRFNTRFSCKCTCYRRKASVCVSATAQQHSASCDQPGLLRAPWCTQVCEPASHKRLKKHRQTNINAN